MLLEEESINPNITDSAGTTPLAWAAAKGSVDIVKLLLQHKHINVNAPEKGNPTPLGLAAGAGHTEVIKELLAHSKLNINESCEAMGGSALLVAAWKGEIEVVDLILQDGQVEPNCADYFRQTALWWAAYNGHTEMVICLVQNCRINMFYHCDPVLAAEREGHREITQFLQAVRSSTTPSINSTAHSTRQGLLNTRS